MVSGLPWGMALVSGVNTYLPLFLLALFARFTHAVHLSPKFEFLASDQALIILGLLAASEILAQKFPGLDNVWDFLHTLLRPMAGAIAAGAAVDTNQTLEMAVAMLMGGTLAAAAHSAKSGARLVSTTKSFGLANTALSFGEDAAVIGATLLSVYAPWVMLALVVVFVLSFFLIAPWLVRTLLFDCRIVFGWLRWVGRRLLHVPNPLCLEESVLEAEPHRVKSLSANLAPGEELKGVLVGWQKTRGGPRPCYWLLTSHRVLIAESRLFRNAKLESLAYADLSVARFRNLGLFSRVELLARQNRTFTLHLRRVHGLLGELAVQQIVKWARLSGGVGLLETAATLEPADKNSSPELNMTPHDLTKKYTVN